MNNSIEFELSKSRNIASKIDLALYKIPIKETANCLVPVLFFSTALEHSNSIILLVENHKFGSASTLIRPLFEAFVKGIWFATCAKTKDFERLQKDKCNKKFDGLVTDIANAGHAGLKNIKKEYWRVMNSFTHSGAGQLSRRIDSQQMEIAPNYSDAFLIDILNFSRNYGYNAGIELAKISEDLNALKALVEISKLVLD